MGARYIVRIRSRHTVVVTSTTTSTDYGPRFVAQPAEFPIVPSGSVMTARRRLEGDRTSCVRPSEEKIPTQPRWSIIVRILRRVGMNGLPIAWTDHNLSRGSATGYDQALSSHGRRLNLLAGNKSRIYTAVAVSSVCSRTEPEKQDTEHGEWNKASMSFRWYCPDQVLTVILRTRLTLQ